MRKALSLDSSERNMTNLLGTEHFNLKQILPENRKRKNTLQLIPLDQYNTDPKTKERTKKKKKLEANINYENKCKNSK